MSDMGTIIDDVLASAVVAVTALKTANTERDLRLTANMNPEEFPHLFAYDPEEAIELFDDQQERIITTIQFVLVSRDQTQEELLLDLDLIRDAVRADKTLGGNVRWSHVSTRGVRQDPRVSEKAGDFAVIAVQEA